MAGNNSLPSNLQLTAKAVQVRSTCKQVPLKKALTANEESEFGGIWISDVKLHYPLTAFLCQALPRQLFFYSLASQPASYPSPSPHTSNVAFVEFEYSNT